MTGGGLRKQQVGPTRQGGAGDPMTAPKARTEDHTDSASEVRIVTYNTT